MAHKHVYLENSQMKIGTLMHGLRIYCVSVCSMQGNMRIYLYAVSKARRGLRSCRRHTLPHTRRVSGGRPFFISIASLPGVCW